MKYYISSSMQVQLLSVQCVYHTSSVALFKKLEFLSVLAAEKNISF